MKKYLLGSFAVILAIGFSAFTKSSNVKGKVFTDYYFSFNYSNSPTLTNIQDETKWVLSATQDLETGCDAFDTKACKIKVPEAYTTGTGASRKPASSANIVGSESSTSPSIAFVVLDINSQVTQVRNKQ